MTCTWAALAFLLACSSRIETGAVPTARQPDLPTATAPAAIAIAIDRAVQLAKADHGLSALLAARADGWTRDGDWATSLGWRSAEHKRFEGIGARIPDHADGTREIGLSRFERFRLRIRPEGANGGATLELHEGRAVYADAWPSTDVILATTADRFEELLVLKDERAPREFAWHVDMPRGIKDVRREADGALTFADAKGEMVMRMPPAFAVDAKGTRRAVEVEWRDSRLAVTVETRGLAYPVLVDPALETAVWEQKFPATSPPPRYYTSMVYDAAHGVSVLFGGQDDARPADFYSYLADTWLWDGTTWTNASPAASPPGRAQHGLAYDGTRGRVVLFGGAKGNTGDSVFGDTWEWDGATWLQRSPANSPDPRFWHAMAFDRLRGVTVLFGGYATLSDTWEWNGVNWAQRLPATVPRGRSRHGLAFDGAQGLTVLFGGEESGGSVNDTWGWDGGNWTKQTPAKSAPLRSEFPMAYDSTRHTTIVFSGSGYNTTLDDTWEWDGADWTETSPTTSPTTRYGHALAYDSARHRTVLFGGFGPPFGDTWEYHARGEACSSGSDCDTGHCVDGVCCEQASCTGTCMACDTAANPGVCSPVTNAQDADTCTGANTCGPTGQCGLPNGQSCSTTGQCASRFCADGLCCDAACSGSCDACNGAAQGWAGAVNGTCTLAPLSFVGNPACGTYACTGASASCATSCAADEQCAPNDYCSSSGNCLPRKAQAGTCDLDADCAVPGCRECVAGKTCKDGFCCNGACGAACQTCSATPGTCTAVHNAADADTCTGASTCSATGSCGLANGQACNGGAATCASGLCSDALCCNTACSGGCDVCDATPGTCTLVASGGPGASPSCSPYVCGGSSAACPVGCTSDANCADGFYCAANGTCAARKAQGATCNDATGADCKAGGCRVCQAGEGACADGYCCNTGCAGACDACNGAARGWPGAVNGACALAPSGFAGEPACGAYACTGSDPTCVGQACQSDHDCGASHYCDKNGNCQPQKAQGAVCDQAVGADCHQAGCAVCATGSCADGICCDQPCSGGCDVCKQLFGASASGTCTVLPKGAAGYGCGAFLCDGANSSCPATGSCALDADCAAGNFCDGQGTCQPRKHKSLSCTSSHECAPVDSNASGFGYCVDGVCCADACSSNGCSACSAALKSSGQDDGTCGPAKAGSDPHDYCLAEPQASCGQTGSCDGNGGCQFWPEKSSCGATFCTLENVTGQVCSGLGECISVATQPCTPYLCQNGGCTSPCASSAQCDTGHYCIGGTCSPKQGNGKACSSGEVCESGFCVDGVCCDSPCGGQCEACALSRSVGVCTPVTGTPIAPRVDCAGTAPCKGTCNGGDRTSCAFPDQATSCGDASCMGDVLLLDPRCDGAGKCASARSQGCAPYGCDTAKSACRTGCASDAQCATGAVCDSAKKACAASGNVCKDAFTVQALNGAETSCAPYKCVAGGCQQQCVKDSDCADGYGCAQSACVRSGAGAAGANSGSSSTGGGPRSADSGCGCRLASKPDAPLHSGAVSLLAGSGLAAWARRRSARKGTRAPAKN